MARRERPPTPQMVGALRFLNSRGEMTVRQGPNRFIMDEVSVRTAYALERRGWAERRWTGGEDGVIYASAAGLAAEQQLDPPTCPHRCGPLRWCDEQWVCPVCGDEWGEEVES